MPDYGNKHVYLYSVVADSGIKNEPCFPIFEFIESAHDVATICSALTYFKLKSRDLLEIPDYIVMDCSWAFMHAVSECFNGFSLATTLSKQWQEIIEEKDILKTKIILCCNHFISNMSKKVSKLTTSKKVKK